MLMTGQRFLHGKSLHVPQLYVHICAARRKHEPILVESDKFHDSSVSFQRAFVLTLLKVPQADFCIL